MYRFATTFVRTLAIVAVTSLVGCDDPDGLELEDLEDLEDIEDSELRDGPLPVAAIPTDLIGPGTLTFSIPMQPVAKFKPKSGFSLHGPTDLAYIWTPDPTGAPDTILVDVNGVSPYAYNLMETYENACTAFLETHPFYVPVTDSPETCEQIEQGCCDRICYIWGGTAIESEGHNVAVPVTNATFESEEVSLAMVDESYIGTGHLAWSFSAPNGGYSSRETVCGCACAMPVP